MNFMCEEGVQNNLEWVYIYTEHGRSEEVKQKEARGGCNGATGIWEGGGPL